MEKKLKIKEGHHSIIYVKLLNNLFYMFLMTKRNDIQI